MTRKPLVVLVSDPDPIIADVITDMLQAKGYAAIPIRDAAQGVRVTDTVLFDVAVMSLDPHHTKLDISLISALKGKQRPIKVVGMSANADQPSPASLATIDVFLRKPFSMQQLDESIRQLTSQREL